MNIDEKVKQKFKKLGKHISKLREEKGITIKELSELTGIRKEYLNKIENGTAYRVMLERHLFKISKALRVGIYELFDSK